MTEAKAAAALGHPNICTVYVIAEADDKTFIAMEFVKGETLEKRIVKLTLSRRRCLRSPEVSSLQQEDSVFLPRSSATLASRRRPSFGRFLSTARFTGT